MKLQRSIDLLSTLAVLGIIALGALVVTAGFWLFTR